MKHKTIIIVAAILIFFLSLGITLYPLISNYVNQKYASTIYTKYEEMIQNVDETELQEARSLAQSYNQALAPVSSYDKEGISEASHNYDSLLNLGGNGIMGYIEIPCIQVNLPIYHGTDTETLERGVGHLLGSSLPVGGSSTHAVLSGHSGMAGQKMFTDLLQMKTGDIFYLHVLGETLAYEVDRHGLVTAQSERQPISTPIWTKTTSCLLPMPSSQSYPKCKNLRAEKLL